MFDNLNSKRVFQIFFEICNIPHGSGNCSKIADYCESFARARSLEYKRDKHHNLVIYKPGIGEALAVQAHTDMVCEKTDEREIDFLTDPIIPKINGDYITAEGTTLGADNGIGVAMCLALLEAKVEIPLVIVLTADEEIGLLGANGIDRSWITASKLINLDSEEQGVITVGCASGATAEVKMPLDLIPEKGKLVTLTVSGLAGGHSGVDINKGRLNAVKLLAAVLSKIDGIQLAEISGGTKDNVIPRKAVAKFFINCSTESLDSAIELVIAEAGKTEATTSIEYTVCDGSEKALTETDSSRVVNILNQFPSGVMSMSPEVEGMVESSLNLSIVGIDNGFYAGAMVRSSKNSAAEKIFNQIHKVALEYGAESNCSISFPAWEYRQNSKLQAVAEESYRQLFEKDPEIQIIHAGLECGVLGNGIEGLESISIGPNLWDVHTVEEKLSISSTENVWLYVLKIIENLQK